MEPYIKTQKTSDSTVDYTIDFESLSTKIPSELDLSKLNNILVQDFEDRVEHAFDPSKIYSLDETGLDDEIFMSTEDDNYRYIVVSAHKRIKIEGFLNKLNDYIGDLYKFFRCQWIEEYDEDGDVERNGIAIIDDCDYEMFFADNGLFNPELDGEEGSEYVDYMHYMEIKESKKACYAHLLSYTWNNFSDSVSFYFKVAIPKG